MNTRYDYEGLALLTHSLLGYEYGDTESLLRYGEIANVDYLRGTFYYKDVLAKSLNIEAYLKDRPEIRALASLKILVRDSEAVIKGLSEFYLATASIDPPPSSSDEGWTKGIPSDFSLAKRYLWNKHETALSDGSIDSRIFYVTEFSEDKELLRIEELYAVSGSASTPPELSEFTQSISEVSLDNRYLWRVLKYIYSDGIDPEFSEKIVISTYGTQTIELLKEDSSEWKFTRTEWSNKGKINAEVIWEGVDKDIIDDLDIDDTVVITGTIDGIPDSLVTIYGYVTTYNRESGTVTTKTSNYYYSIAAESPPRLQITSEDGFEFRNGEPESITLSCLGYLGTTMYPASSLTDIKWTDSDGNSLGSDEELTISIDKVTPTLVVNLSAKLANVETVDTITLNQYTDELVCYVTASKLVFKSGAESEPIKLSAELIRNGFSLTEEELAKYEFTWKSTSDSSFSKSGQEVTIFSTDVYGTSTFICEVSERSVNNE